MSTGDTRGTASLFQNDLHFRNCSREGETCLSVSRPINVGIRDKVSEQLAVEFICCEKASQLQ